MAPVAEISARIAPKHLYLKLFSKYSHSPDLLMRKAQKVQKTIKSARELNMETGKAEELTESYFGLVVCAVQRTSCLKT